MKGLTIWQPWAWACTNASKRVENRSWPAPARLVGQRIAIHAGQRFDDGACEWMRLRLLARAAHDPEPDGTGDAPLLPDTYVRGAVVATAVLARCRRLADIPPAERTPWHAGLWCWELEDVRVLDQPVPCKGRQGLWDLPPEVEAEIERQALGGAPA